MSIVSGPKIIDDGLVLYLDAGNEKSYSGSGTTILDLKETNTVTPYNGVSFESSNNGYFYFDGINDYILTNLSTISVNATYSVWVNRTSDITAYNMVMGQYLPYFGMRSNGRLHFSMRIAGQQQSLYSSEGSVENNKWYNLVFTHNYDGTNTLASIYINGELKTSQSYVGSQSTSSGRTFMLGNWNSLDPTDSLGRFNGKISNVSIYNICLTLDQIKQNFNALRSRYGI